MAAFRLAQAASTTTVMVVMVCALGVAMVGKPARSIRFDGLSFKVARLPGADGPAVNPSSFDDVERDERPRRFWPSKREVVLSGPSTELRIGIDDMADRHRHSVLTIGFGPERLRLPLSN